MLLALLFTAGGQIKDAFELVVDALHDFPHHYGLLVLRLKLEVRFGMSLSRLCHVSSFIQAESRRR